MKRITILFLVFFMITAVLAQHRTNIVVKNAGSNAQFEVIAQQATKMLSACNTAFADGTQPAFNDNDTYNPYSIKNLLKLWETSPFFCPETEVSLDVLKIQNSGGFELRGIPVQIKTNTGESHGEELVLVYNAQAKLEDVYFGIENHKYRKLLSEGLNPADVRRRQMILDFVENFRTAYNRKDTKYLDGVFSDDALIIVGRVIEQQPDQVNYLERNLTEKQVKLIKYSKQEYMKNLKACFKSNAYIKVAFDRLEILQSRRHPEIYGVTMVQAWTSSLYSDKGFLFLMIDFRDESKPMIHVRAWQPTEFTKQEEVISLGNFDIVD